MGKAKANDSQRRVHPNAQKAKDKPDHCESSAKRPTSNVHPMPSPRNYHRQYPRQSRSYYRYYDDYDYDYDYDCYYNRGYYYTPKRHIQHKVNKKHTQHKVKPKKASIPTMKTRQIWVPKILIQTNNVANVKGPKQQWVPKQK